MISIPKKILQFSLILFTILAIIFIYLILVNINEIDYIFKYINYFFSTALMFTISNNLYQREIKKSEENKTFFSLFFLITLATVLALYTIKILNFDLQREEILFWQISSPLLAILTLFQLIPDHVNAIKRQENNVA